MMNFQEKTKNLKSRLANVSQRLQGQADVLKTMFHDWGKEEKDDEGLIEESALVSVLESEWTCVICEGVFIDPSSLACGHTFCLHCLCDWLSKKEECPICREPCCRLNPNKNVSMSSMIERTYSTLISSKDLKKKRAQALRERSEEVKKAEAAAWWISLKNLSYLN